MNRMKPYRLALVAVLPLAICVAAAATLSCALGSTERIPVAVVNLDRGSTTESGKAVHAGDDAVDTLLESDDLAWSVVGKKAAREGLEDGTYALVVTIPADYSACVSSLTGADPQKATIDIASNGAENVLATRAGGAVLKQLQGRLRQDLGEDYVLSVLSDVRGGASKLSLAADGAVMLQDGTDALSQAADGLDSGLSQVASASAVLGTGAEQVASGADALATGAQALSTGIDQVNGNLVAPLAAGGASLATALDAVGSTARSLGAGVTGAAAALDGLGQNLDAAQQDALTLVGLSTRFGSESASLRQAMGDVSAAKADAQQSADKLVDAIDGALDGAQGTAQAAAESDLALNDETTGLVAELAAIDKKIDDATDEVAAAAQDLAQADTQDAVAAVRTRLDSAAGALQDLKAERKDLSGRLADLARDAHATSESAGAVAASLEGAGSARDAFDAASDSYDEASQAALGHISSLTDTSAAAAGPAVRVASSLVVAQKTVSGNGAPGEEGYVPGLATTLSGLGAGIDALGTQLSSDGALGKGAAASAAGAASLSAVLSPFATGASALGTGASSLSQAIGAIGDGARSLGDGLGAMTQVTGALSSGIGQLSEANGNIVDVLKSTSSDLLETSSSSQDRARVASNPVTSESSSINPQRSSAARVAAVAAGAALWCGVIVLCVLLPGIDRRRVIAGRAAGAVLELFGRLFALGLLQAAALLCGLAVFAPGAALLPAACALATGVAACSACAVMLRVALGRAGTPVAIALLAIQLAAPGALLPSALSCGALAPISWLPVPQMACALRRAVAGVQTSFAAPCIAMLAAACVFIAVAVAASSRYRRVRPEVLA